MRRNSTFFIVSNKSIPLPVRKAKEGERVAIVIRGAGYTVCDAAEKEFTCSINREALKAAGYEIDNKSVA